MTTGRSTSSPSASPGQGTSAQDPAPRRWLLRPSSLQLRLTLLYAALLALMLASVYGAALVLMRSSLITGLDEGMRNTYSQFSELVAQLALDSPTTEQERDKEGVLPRARTLFPNDAIQIEKLPFVDHDRLLTRLSDAQKPAQQRQELQVVRSQLTKYRYPVTVNRASPLELSDAELLDLIESPTGRIFIARQIREPYSDKTVPYRILVTLAEVQYAPRPLASLRDGDVTVDFMPPPVLSIIYVGRSVAGIEDTLGRLQRVFAIVMLFGALLAGTLAYVLAGRALRPLQEVRQAAERIGGQTLTERVPEPQTGDEVQALARSLNAMLGRLEASFEAQRRFTSDASHELRTPVTAISGHASYLLRRTNPGGQERESLNIIRSESERLTNLITSLLQLARSDSGALTLNPAPIFSRLFLDDVSRELAPLATGGSELRVSGPDIPFEGDPDRLRQVIINLVGNALKAGAKTVTLESSSQEEGREVRLSVRDDGPGIPAEHLSRLFDRFYRVEDSRSRDQGGAGLGLSIAHSIVDAHGGRIWLESEVGRGTVAHVQLLVGDVPVLDEDDVP
ncbi:sensor histidine kinase [Deinococcus radiodurans]|uniref:histidine kinase n=1 Tax=Deinococcus radiodurans (strain ATCC 13939 / DSM 20539 / JCM 16871 / CCUG 27074 / LMG 4051 / NBRC 15346 / NCIMB 9279 / VKM B-1422 / R1) TaxID=243230 RepID=Q9RWC5_DEIRA|nr:ATP-binding protein [Deinococcus radiodurans]AAF10322.1 sensor histidine kinase [Deinococcus radiodurans R1 = ATCC 13939 = DSM 20539]QEM72682.1 HAMP domain-containing protein [Deinococcus radiodurans]UDK99912.1 HAMP domain-containing protein [Deinococcus radiodurans R1 = ATCC 13939 = DSM 20539]UID69742.1 two-component sensor histidine kinase [Deinococcus radiodurans R1 = ATCC 13939 = DSM 20539]HCE64882.1 HAMP domain-containing protein [Deinococcus radiodurans]